MPKKPTAPDEFDFSDLVDAPAEVNAPVEPSPHEAPTVKPKTGTDDTPTIKPPQLLAVQDVDGNELSKTIVPPSEPDLNKTPTVTPPDGSSTFQRLYELLNEKIDREGDINICREMLGLIMEKVQIVDLDPKKSLLKPSSVFLFPFPYFDNLGKLIIKVWPMDTNVDPEKVLHQIRILSYFPTLHTADENKVELDFKQKVNLTAALTVYLQDLVGITPRLDAEALKIDFLEAGVKIEKATFVIAEQLPSIASGRNRGSVLRIVPEHLELLKAHLGEHLLAQSRNPEAIAAKVKKGVRGVLKK
jgi:hypothetical protein